MNLRHLRFGIPSLDALFGDRGSKGIRLPGSDGGSTDSLNSSVSVCISGPDGTGKSILGLHLASRYVADCARAGKARQKVLYISTDLKFGMAFKVWRDFALDWPDRRKVPFEKKGRETEATPAGDDATHVRLNPCSPLKGARGGKPLSEYLIGGDGDTDVYFVDLASSTVGDDWGFVNRVLSVLERPGADDPRHLVVIDSVEGFETLVGERDAFGLVRERRSRIAQVLRSAGDKCHTLFIVEEPKEGERLPEEFVTDVVIRLRSVLVRDYVRRTMEIEKARGHSHVRGQHAYLIRSGAGATTGQRENPDDPLIENVVDDDDPSHTAGRPYHQSYLHICHSLHHSYRKAMTAGKGRAGEPSERYAAFGIRYLDDLLEKGNENFKRSEGNDQRGLRCSTTTALIGNPETQKGPLGVAFLSRCFREYATRFGDLIDELVNPGQESPDDARLEIIRNFLPSTTAILDGSEESSVEKRRGAISEIAKKAVAEIASKTKHGRLISNWVPDNIIRHSEALYRLNRAGILKSDDSNNGRFTEDVNRWQENERADIDPLVKAAAWMLGPPAHPNDGVPVLLTTQHVDAQKLVREFLPWLLRKVPKLRQYKEKGSIAALRILIEQYTICRRLEIHDLPSAVLIHILQRGISDARNILHGRNEGETLIELAEKSQGIRVVIDDFSILKDTYIEIREEPLLSRFIVFYLGQEGVTTLLIDTQPGRPDTAVASPLHSELRSLVDNRIYTWRFPFYGEDRVAIAVIPSISGDTPAVIRELRGGVRSASGPESLPLVVDPHFELYSGIEKGEPKPIQLEIWLFEEAPAFKAYIEEENQRYASLFMPLWKEQPGGTGRVIAGIPANDYDEYRDICYLQRDTRLDHSLIFQVDEFWVMPTSPGLRRAGTFRPQWKYLNATTAEKSEEERLDGENWKREWAVDPFRLFQKTVTDAGKPEKHEHTGKDDKHRRRYEFVYDGYESKLDKRLDEKLNKEPNEEMQKLKASVDRVPFMWDFGFLLCKVRAWEEAEDLELAFWKHSNPESKLTTIKDVWDGLPKAVKGLGTADDDARPGTAGDGALPVTTGYGARPSWRVFLEACYQLARKQAYSSLTPVTAFDIHGASSQTLSSLVLEIWASEIYQYNKDGAVKLEQQVTKRPWHLDTKSGGLIQWLTDYRKELFRVWLLLVEVLDFNVMAKSVDAGTLRSLEPNPTAITVRHWYKTACQVTGNLSFDDPIVPVGLPGHFSVRGDWFIAAAGGSRSGRLAERGIDLLTSRRANHIRLQKGLGLPVRRLEDPELPTAILSIDYGSGYDPKLRSRRISRVKYSNLVSIGNDPENDTQNFHWLWRSGLSNYHRHTRIWQNWLEQMIKWWDRMRYVYRDNWVNGFERYDSMVRGNTVEAWDEFNRGCNRLVKELKQATLD
jgi:KaiC/GvpD/RAD55 family RecA-like ATPase